MKYEGTLFNDILDRLEHLDLPDRRLDAEIACLMPLEFARFAWPAERPGDIRMEYDDRHGQIISAYSITGSVEQAIFLFRVYFPDWYYTAGSCELTGHATIGPDYNGKRGAELKVEFPVDKFADGFSADLAPGGSDFRVAIALSHCMVQALKAIAELKVRRNQERVSQTLEINPAGFLRPRSEAKA